jgi:hypothetical protein
MQMASPQCGRSPDILLLFWEIRWQISIRQEGGTDFALAKDGDQEFQNPTLYHSHPLDYI